MFFFLRLILLAWLVSGQRINKAFENYWSDLEISNTEGSDKEWGIGYCNRYKCYIMWNEVWWFITKKIKKKKESKAIAYESVFCS